MSNPIRYDPVLVRALARELDARLRGRSARPTLLFAPDLSATLVLDRGEALRWDLHPTRGWTRIVAAPDGEDDEPDARITGVSAPPDERVLFVDVQDLSSFGSTRRRVVVELHTNQWNALVTAGDEERIVAVLRGRDAGDRALRIGARYAPPPPSRRFGAGDEAREDAWDAWRTLMGRVAPADRPGALVRTFAWTSTLTAAPVLGDAARTPDEAEVEAAFERWWALRTGEGERPVLLERKRGVQPFPVALPGVASRPAASLLEAMDATAGEAAAAEPADEGRDAERLLRGARRRLGAAEGRVRSLHRELESAGEAERMRRFGDTLLAHLHLVPAGASVARLPDLEGGQTEIEVELDPTLRPHQNAEAWYEKARRLERAAERIPELIGAAEAEAARWREAIGAAEAEGGSLPEWALRALERPTGRPAPKADEGPRLPYRPFRTSGGLEVRVGRSSKDNDLLTFGHSSPGDVWLHARSVPGSHVILRWPDSAAPPARDLEEAATLAALYSKARTSGVVAVDWTRRKHVRKPRGAPPGLVKLQQAKTVFVEPDPAVEERMRDDRAEGAA
ncbi:MAG TPA: NFACT RNA binding domain-containing protein [Longimicrobiaceae bacterium]|nr:NFACT RNA binding domain-containing protein [Longimicrobiaceae bacterium]